MYNIQLYRIQYGWSLAELSRKCGVNLENLRKMENGIIVNPRVYTMRKIAQALNVSIEDLLINPNKNDKGCSTLTSDPKYIIVDEWDANPAVRMPYGYQTPIRFRS